MSRTFLDENLLSWEAFASTGAFGYPEGPRVVFQCLTNRTIRPRYVELEGEENNAQRLLEQIPADELVALFQTARPVS